MHLPTQCYQGMHLNKYVYMVSTHPHPTDPLCFTSMAMRELLLHYSHQCPAPPPMMSAPPFPEYAHPPPRRWVPIGAVSFAVLCLAMPVVCAAMLFIHRWELRAPRVLQTYGFLYTSYK